MIASWNAGAVYADKERKEGFYGRRGVFSRETMFQQTSREGERARPEPLVGGICSIGGPRTVPERI